MSCPALTAELADVLSRGKFSKHATRERAAEYIDSIEECAEHAKDPDIGPHRTSDPDDDYLLALAHAQNADAIVSGDKHLLDAATEAMPVLTPRQLADQLGLDESPPAAKSGEQPPPPGISP